MPSSKSVCATHHWAGPRNTSSESPTCALPATPWTPGLTTLQRFEIGNTFKAAQVLSHFKVAQLTQSGHLRSRAQGRQNIAPDKIPWAALKTLMAQSIYGGRIDNEFDQRLLITFLERIFTKGSFDSEFKLASKVDGHKDIKMPDGIRSVGGGSDRLNRTVRFRQPVVLKCVCIAGGRSSCTGWRCSRTPRRHRGSGCPATPRRCCSPRRVRDARRIQS